MVKAKVRDFLARYFKDHEFTDDEDIFASGYLNSLFVMQLIVMVETEFSITLDDDDLDFENFRSLSTIERFVEGKRAVAVSA